MRIRKRFLQSLSAATPAPSSEPNRGDDHREPLLLVQEQEVHPNGNLSFPHDETHPQPSDLPLTHRRHPLLALSSGHAKQIGLPPSTWVPSGAGSEPPEPEKLEGESKRETIKINDTNRNENILCAEIGSSASIGSLPTPPMSSHLVLKGWLEGDKMIPIKKRRGSFGKRANHDLDLEEDNEMIERTMKMKMKQNNKYVVTQEVSATSVKKNKKNVKRGNVIMEGSRCSRVNGRGWRCCQQTLVGYSLCEHHLGKGRLRSVTSVRGRAQKVSLKEHKEVEMILMDDHEFEDEDDDDEEEFKDSDEELKNKTSKKKKKIGMVKARSLSSLLSQIGS